MLSWQFLYNETIISRGRNVLVNNTLKDETATHLLFVDADMKFRPEDILLMLQADKDVIAAVCPRKEINWNNVRTAVQNNDPCLEKRTGNYNFIPLVQQGEYSITQYEPLEVARAGTGVMLIKTSVFNELKDKVNSFKDNNDELIPEFFKMEIDANGIFIGEDYYFCNLYRANGGKIFVAPWTEIGHYGPMLYQGTIF
jgi:hypothetical protein